MTIARKLMTGCTLLALAAIASASPVPGPASQADPVARNLTISLLDANARYGAAPARQRAQALANLLSVAQSRHDELATLIESDPAEFLRVTLPPNLLAQLPAEAKPFLEQDAVAQGLLTVYHVDYADPPGEEYLYTLMTTTATLSLHFAANPTTLLSGSQIRVHGVQLDSAMVLADGTQTNVTTLAAALPNTLGAQKTLTMLVNFYDETTQPYTVAYAQSMMFTTTSNYDYEASYQQTWLTGDVAGWFTINVSSTTCDYGSIASYANQAASNAGFVLSNYTRYVYVFPANACTWWGLGTVGGNPSQAWIHTKWGYTLPVVGHEMGHNFGLYHSHSLDCGSVPYATSGCTASEYGDVFDIMGGNNPNSPHFNAYQKEQLGWLNAGVSPPLTTVPVQTGSAQYTIEPLEKARDTASRALKIAMTTSCSSTTQYYYVESRQALGFDSYLSGNTNVLGGVLVHNETSGSPNSSYLLDMTAATTAWSDAALDAGITYVDPVSGLTITPLSVGSGSTTVSVNFPTSSCTRANPSIALTPSGTEYTAAGATASYTVTVTNNDSCGCSASSFNIAASVPTGWSATNPTIGSVPPGTSASTSLGITSSSSASAAYYTVPSAATNASAPTYTASTNATIAVITSLGVSVATDKTTYTRPTRGNQSVNAKITTSVTSSGSPVSGAAVSVQVKDPGGKITTLSGTTGSTGTLVVSYPIKKTSLTGGYAVTSTATVGTMSSSNTASFNVQ